MISVPSGRFDKVQIKTQKVAGNIYMLEGAGGNIGVSVGKDGMLIIDDQFAPLAAKIASALRKLSKGKLKFILNTHWHGDHRGGNEHFAKKGTIIAHENVRKRMQTGLKKNFFGRNVPKAKKGALPIITFEKSLSIHFNGEEIAATHFPNGHTDGDSVIFFKDSDVVHMGDHYFSRGFPFIDQASGGNAIGYVNNIKSVLSRIRSSTKVIPGHGPLSNKSELSQYVNILEESITHIRKMKDSGKSLEQAKKAGLPGKFAKWGQGFIKAPQWIHFVYTSL